MYVLWQARLSSFLAPGSDVHLLLRRVLTSERGLWGKGSAGMGPGTGQPDGKSTPGWIDIRFFIFVSSFRLCKALSFLDQIFMSHHLSVPYFRPEIPSCAIPPFNFPLPLPYPPFPPSRCPQLLLPVRKVGHQCGSLSLAPSWCSRHCYSVTGASSNLSQQPCKGQVRSWRTCGAAVESSWCPPQGCWWAATLRGTRLWVCCWGSCSRVG